MVQRSWVQDSDDPVVQQLLKLRLPVTRENYIELAFFGQRKGELGAEEEAELPEQLQQQRVNK